MPSPSQLWGAEQEVFAEQLLHRRGYHIIHRNWRCSGAEVDRIAWQDELLVFIEIRSRHGGTNSMPLETVGRAKRRKLIRAATIYLTRFLPQQMPMVRFDVVGIVWSGQGALEPCVSVVENAFDGLGQVS
ncbi:MAG: YraN family protein [Myxococcales bacterium]|nr:YraN family protein [Myxococcales bacterium]